MARYVEVDLRVRLALVDDPDSERQPQVGKDDLAEALRSHIENDDPFWTYTEKGDEVEYAVEYAAILGSRVRRHPHAAVIEP